MRARELGIGPDASMAIISLRNTYVGSTITNRFLMYPALHLGPYTISSFSAAMLVALLVTTLLGARQSKFVGVDAFIPWRLLPWGAAAGVIGAKLYPLLLRLPDVLRVDLPVREYGELWYGGLALGPAVVTWRFRKLKLPVDWLYDFGAAPLALGHAVGRIGCFLVGDDYRRPTSLPIGMRFPQGAPPTTAANLRASGVQVAASIPDTDVLAVHPTQLYECAALILIGAWLWRCSQRPHRLGACSHNTRSCMEVGGLRLSFCALRMTTSHSSRD